MAVVVGRSEARGDDRPAMQRREILALGSKNVTLRHTQRCTALLSPPPTHLSATWSLLCRLGESRYNPAQSRRDQALRLRLNDKRP